MGHHKNSILNLTRDENPETLKAEFCIIGAGVAGQTLAKTLDMAGRDVLMIESGVEDFNKSIQALSVGENIGQPYYDLETARLRLLGGTAAIWGGRCAELDAIDFEHRDYIPHSGWPIGKSDLDPYYTQSYSDLGLVRLKDMTRGSAAPHLRPSFDAAMLTSGLWSFDESRDRFTNQKTALSPNARLLLGATVTEISVSETGEVTSLTAKTLQGRSLTVHAKHFILAAGAIENIRILLTAVPSRPKGFGNAQDVVGRYFMEHPHARGGEIVTQVPAKVLSGVPRALRTDGKRYAGYVRLSDARQREKQVLNSSISIGPRRHEGQNTELFRSALNTLKHDLPSNRYWRDFYKILKGGAVKALEWTDPWSSIANMKASRGKLGLYAIIRAEQSPNPDSRVTVNPHAKDALGIPRAVLDWQLQALDKRSVIELMNALEIECDRLGWGQVKHAPWLSDPDLIWKTDPLISAHPIGGYHHMGGTRMGTDIRDSVVNADCRLHESPNFYIAGSSVFPTGGWANPTVTIMALSKRLGEHLISISSPKTPS